jgi:hypothetical protein
MRAARVGGDPGKGSKGGKGGKGGNSYQPPVDEYDDRVSCPHCGRKFAELVA